MMTNTYDSTHTVQTAISVDFLYLAQNKKTSTILMTAMQTI